MFFLIIGIRPRRRPVPSPLRRVSPCPGCGQRHPFEEVRVVPYLDLFFIPLFPVGRGTRVLKCANCGFEVPTAGIWGEVWKEAEVVNTVSPPSGPERAEPRDWGLGPAGGRRRASTEQQIYCVHCGRRFGVRASDGLQRVRCPICERDFEVGL